MDYEIRSASMWEADYEVRTSGDGLTFEGYAAVFNRPSLPLQFPGIGGGRRFREIIEPGAFTETLAGNPDVALVLNHDLRGIPLASTWGGTMRLAEDDKGLRVEATLPESEWGRSVSVAVGRKDIRGMSFRFNAAKDKWAQDGDMRVRTLLAVNLGPEVSATGWPAYPETEASVRDLADAAEVTFDELDAAFRALGDMTRRMTSDETALLRHLINVRSDEPVVLEAIHRRRLLLARRMADIEPVLAGKSPAR